MMRIYLSICFSLFFAGLLHATHNRAGEITYEQIGDLTIRVTITTYTKTSSVPADRDTLELFWGDGTSSMIGRSNGNGNPQPNDIKINYYISEHTYPGRATYTLSMMDPNRIGGISNVNPPNSEGVPFYLETTFTFLNTQFQGFNSSPVLLQPPLDFACVGKRYIHNPNAYDPDLGDSLSYELIVPLQDSGLVVPNYIYPDQILPGPTNHISLDPISGDFVWDAPAAAGTYNIAIRINEYRNGILVNTMVRDMQIIVLTCDNDPPHIQSRDDYCVVAGDTLEFTLSVSDPDEDDLVQLTMLGGPLQISDQVTLSVNPVFMAPPYQATFRWVTRCDEISPQYYTMVFRAVDNSIGGSDTTGLADLKTVRIKVVGPPPEEINAQSSDQVIRVSWAMPYACEETEDNYFRGFSVWRREGAKVLPQDTCNPGLAGMGYIKLSQDVKDSGGGRYIFDDLDVDRGRTYCYRVQAEFARRTASGQPYNRVPGLHSEEACVQLNRDVPLITHVTVDETSTNGAMTIRWVKPLAEALDTTINPPPYRFELQQSPGIGSADFTTVAGSQMTFQTFAAITDTMVMHAPLNTVDQGHNYRVQFEAGSIFSDFSPEASSVFLNAVPTDRAVDLSWDFITPWNNYSFEIYRQEPSGDFVLRGTTNEITYRDAGLVNGEEYCYYVRTIGTYGIDGIPDPLFNLSQEICVIPIDNVAPCAPVAEVKNICGQAGNATPEDEFRNTILWNDVGNCGDDDVALYRIYYASSSEGTLELIGEVDVNKPKSFVHQPDMGIAGCYAVTSVDTAGNESALSNVICVDNCPLYTLPNVFTPNGDGSNDYYIPFPYRFIERVEMKVFNRWGQLVYETTDPALGWDGTNLQGTELADGVYHYVCLVHEQPSSSGVQETRQLQGFIELIRGRK